MDEASHACSGKADPFVHTRILTRLVDEMCHVDVYTYHEGMSNMEKGVFQIRKQYNELLQSCLHFSYYHCVMQRRSRHP
jgi:hypothetical protein